MEFLLNADGRKYQESAGRCPMNKGGFKKERFC
jgi:hypothetical protein